MNFIAAGIGEFGRKICRTRLRLILLSAKKKLRRAEIELGWLGWQRTDFFSAEMLEQVEKIEQFEKEQAKLLNLSAKSAAIVRDLESQRVDAREALAQKLAGIEQQREPARKSLADLEPACAEKRRTLERFKTAIAELEKMPSALDRRHAELMAIQSPTHEMRAEMLRIGDQRRRIPAEKEELQKNQYRVAQEIKELEVTISEEGAVLADCAEAERAARQAFQETDAALAARIRDCTREAGHSNRRMDSLDTKKAEPFLLIGRCLADHDISPVNQPEVLERVFDLRAKIEKAGHDLEQSLADSTSTDAWCFYLSIVCFLLLALLLAALLWR